MEEIGLDEGQNPTSDISEPCRVLSKRRWYVENEEGKIRGLEAWLYISQDPRIQMQISVNGKFHFGMALCNFKNLTTVL